MVLATGLNIYILGAELGGQLGLEHYPDYKHPPKAMNIYYFSQPGMDLNIPRVGLREKHGFGRHITSAIWKGEKRSKTQNVD